MRLDPRVKVDQISIRIAKVERTSTPWLSRGRLDPVFYAVLEPRVFVVDVGDFELENCALVTAGHCRAWDVLLLRIGGEDCQHCAWGVEFGIIVAGSLSRNAQDLGIKLYKQRNIFRDQAGISEYWRCGLRFRGVRFRRRGLRRSPEAEG